MWEVLEMKDPLHEMTRQEIIKKVLDHGYRPPITPKPEAAPYISLMEQCWNVDVTQRPSMPVLLEKV